MKKGMILWMLLLLMVCGGKAQAAGITANEILDKAEVAMKKVNVISYCTMDETNRNTETVMDTNTGVMYINYGRDGDTWLDTKSKMSYVSDGSTCYFLPEDDVQEINAKNVDFSADIDRTLNFTYEGIQNYTIKGQSIACYKLSAAYSEGGFRQIVYYINKDTYRIAAIEESMNGVVVDTTWYDYPNKALTVPQEIKDKAVLMTGYYFVKKKIVYMVEEENNSRVLYVVGSNQAKGNVKIPDTIKLFGESYEVSCIVEGAFYNNRKIKSVTIGKNVRVIEEEAFYGCKKLSKVTIQSKKLKTIRKKAFGKNAKTLKFKVPKSKKAKYKKLIKKSGLKSGFTVK